VNGLFKVEVFKPHALAVTERASCLRDGGKLRKGLRLIKSKGFDNFRFIIDLELANGYPLTRFIFCIQLPCSERITFADRGDLEMNGELCAALNLLVKDPGGCSGAADIITRGTPVAGQGFHESILALLCQIAAGAFFGGSAGNSLPVVPQGRTGLITAHKADFGIGTGGIFEIVSIGRTDGGTAVYTGFRIGAGSSFVLMGQGGTLRQAAAGAGTGSITGGLAEGMPQSFAAGGVTT